MEFVDKAAIVVGGFGGVGLETCKILISRGISSLGVFDVQDIPEKLEFLESFADANILVKFWKVDVTNKAECKAAFDSAISEFGFIDLVVHSVGIVDELSPERTIEVNLLGTINVNLTAIDCMDKEKDYGRGGTILTISSVMGLEPCPPYPVYAATKHGVIGFLRSLGRSQDMLLTKLISSCPVVASKEVNNHYPIFRFGIQRTEELYNRTGIKIIVVCPGFTRPSMPKSAPDPIFAHLPMGTIGDKFQPAEGCAQCLIEAIETNQNGSIWIIDNIELTQVAPIKYFFPPPSE